MTNTSDFPNLSNSPITEALIDIQTTSDEPCTFESLISVKNSLINDFPNVEQQQAGIINFNFSKDESSASSNQEPTGFIMRTDDKLYAAQILLNRVSISRLKPYLDWSELRIRMERLWPIYRDVTSAVRVKRLAVRNINKLLLPDATKKLGYYFTNPMTIPDGLPQNYANYLVRAVIPDVDIDSVAIIQQILEGITPDNQISIIFDIDTFKEVDIDVNDKENIWSTIEELHRFKNRIFFNSITENTKELFL